jgi:hypothetical protein
LPARAAGDEHPAAAEPRQQRFHVGWPRHVVQDEQPRLVRRQPGDRPLGELPQSPSGRRIERDGQTRQTFVQQGGRVGGVPPHHAKPAVRVAAQCAARALLPTPPSPCTTCTITEPGGAPAASSSPSPGPRPTNRPAARYGRFTTARGSSRAAWDGRHAPRAVRVRPRRAAPPTRRPIATGGRRRPGLLTGDTRRGTFERDRAGRDADPVQPVAERGGRQLHRRGSDPGLPHESGVRGAAGRHVELVQCRREARGRAPVGRHSPPPLLLTPR